MESTMQSTPTEASPGPTEPRTVTVRAPGEGDAIWFLDNFITIKASGRDGARFGLLENALPQGSHTPLHRHLDDDESFYVLEGTLRVHVESGPVIEARPGTFVHIPHGVAHGLRAVTPVRFLVLSDPAGFVEFVRDFGIEAPRRELPPAAPPDVERLVAVARKHRIEVLGPLPE